MTIPIFSLEALQGRLVFGRPTRVRPLLPGPHAGSYRIQAHRLERPDGAVLEGWSSAPSAGAAEGVVLYFGGRNENVGWAPDMASYLRGHAVFAFNYRGFGGSTGWPSERHARQDALAAYRYLAARHKLENLTVVGRSLGTAVALGLASAVPTRRMVLMSPFESVAQVLRGRGAWWALLAGRGLHFDCTRFAAACAAPALVLLAEQDGAIAPAQSLRLCERLPHPPLVETVAGTTHRSLPRAAATQAAIARFIAAG